MRELPLGWATDIAVLGHMGSTIDDRGDHLVLRTPQNPLFHWGNCVFVTDSAAVDDAQRWVAVFEAAVPEADWLAIGLPQMPMNTAAWATCGAELELDDVLATATVPRQAPMPPGYAVRALTTDGDWAQFVDRDIAINDEEGQHDRLSHERFARARAQAYREMSEREVARFVGAFSADTLVAELGIIRCGDVARYQTVGTDPAHRGRGLCAHLLGVAGAWAAQRDCTQWVIVTSAINPAGRVYRRAGFASAAPIVTAYRAPA
jgi:GNAT superfamily N-acetyltransferase